ncbi:penicillin-binding transpeptidase domain-containing protein [Dethiobacter alkaliphilus]|uniref:penicillin-binding transpeptidase domain-containing protein n=1 Tax=Dethiobacter alkaliphilus TaxID=427926 RepID=UPI0022278285|nr:penicillin-binding transpeptidase domain-containing protein [Dethiobacter alkaliphilus]MCW3489677.1 penicillin-binding transpeptidase domain-containing protein [Dethiobacter alkaliphilus]
MRKIIWFFLLLLLLFLVGGCGETFPAPEETLLEFTELWDAGEYEKMYEFLSEESQSFHDLEVFVSRYANISSGLVLQSLTLQEVEIPEDEENSEQKSVIYTLFFETGTVPQFTQEYHITLHKGEEKWLMDWEHEHILTGLTADTSVRVSRDFPQRGGFYDRNNTPLVYRGQVREVGVVPGRIGDEEALLSGMAEVLQISEERINAAYTQSWVQPDMFVPIQRITEDFWQENQDELLALQGILVNRAESRVYDLPVSHGPAIGHLSEITAETLEELKEAGYRAGDYVGSIGLEAFFEERLAGSIGFSITINNGENEAIHTVAEKAAVDGEDIELTLDKDLVRAVDWALGRYNGSALILDAGTGDILAMASKPGFDSNLFSLGITPQQFNELRELDSPFTNRVLRTPHPPGSVFKAITAKMALEAEVFDPDEAWNTPRQWQKDAGWGSYHVRRVDRPEGEIDLRKAMKWSDNVYFADLSLKIGWDKFEEYAQRLGFGEVPSHLPMRASQVISSSPRETLLADSGYGQGELQVTPLHMGLMIAAISRGDGNLPQPRITMGDDTGIWQETGFSAENIALVDETLQAAVQDEDALAYISNSSSLGLRGKTGTAQITEEKQIGWFVSYFDDYVIVVALEGDSSITSREAVSVSERILEYGF